MVTDSAATLADEVEVRSYAEFPISLREVRDEDEAMVVDRHMEDRVPGAGGAKSREVFKRMKVGEQVVGALYARVKSLMRWKLLRSWWMNTFKMYTPVLVEESQGKLILDSAWVETRKPSGEHL